MEECKGTSDGIHHQRSGMRLWEAVSALTSMSSTRKVMASGAIQVLEVQVTETIKLDFEFSGNKIVLYTKYP